jgi:hypothetical protein
MRQDSATFWDKGTEVPSLSGTKGQWDKLKIWPWDGTHSVNFDQKVHKPQSEKSGYYL